MEPALAAMDREKRHSIAILVMGRASSQATVASAKEPAFIHLLPGPASNAMELAAMARMHAKNALDQANINPRPNYPVTGVMGKAVILPDAGNAMGTVRSLWNVINVMVRAGTDSSFNSSQIVVYTHAST